MSSVATFYPATMPLVSRRTRAYFAPVNRTASSPSIFDPALNTSWKCDAPPHPWVDLGYIEGFVRTAESKIIEVSTGTPATVRVQAKQSLGATVGFHFATWSKLSMALSSGSDHMNVLAADTTSTPVASGGKATPALALGSTSTALVLYSATVSNPGLQAGCMLVVDQDYVGQNGYVGTPYSSTYVSDPSIIGESPDYIRRFSFNVARIASVGNDGGLNLDSPLPGGAPVSGMKMQQVVSFLDREGGSFFQEWSGLFVFEGVQGDRLTLYYPRLQACQSAAEIAVNLAPGLMTINPTAKFRALPITDGNDGQQVLCYRSYNPSAASLI